MSPQNFLDIIVGAASTSGLITSREIELELEKERGNNKIIVIAGAPKSGSTFLANTIATLTSYKYFRLSSAYSTNEHDLYLPALCMINAQGCVSQLHIKGTFHNAVLMRTFGIKPIILVRNIYDTVISLMHDFRKKQGKPDYGTGMSGFSFLWQDDCIKNLDDEKLIDAIIDLAIPWYVNFYVSWHRLCEKGAIEATWITYEKLMTEKQKTVKTIMTFLGYQDIGKIDPKILTKEFATFRSGKSHHGKNLLSEEQKNRIKKLFGYYPDIDFSLMGL